MEIFSQENFLKFIKFLELTMTIDTYFFKSI